MPVSDPKQTPSEEFIESVRRKFPTEPLVDETLTRKLRSRSGPPYKPKTLGEIAEGLEAFVSKRLPGGARISDVRGLAGGSSKEQYAFRLQWRDESGKDRNEELVLRMRPAESIVETHPLREYQAIKAVRHVMPVPELYWLDADGSELGQPAIIYAFAKGIAEPPREGAYRPKRDFGKRYRELLAPQFVKYFAELAKIDGSSGEMTAFERPRAGSAEGVIRLINWWERVWEEDSVEPVPLMTLAARWLRDNAPAIDHVSLVHQDFRGGNFLFDPDTGAITAILDWEMAVLADRHVDLAYFMNPMAATVDEESGEQLLGGLIPRARFIEDYEALSGLPVDQDRLDYYTVFYSWRGAINALATAPRIVMGQKTHQDIRVGWVAATAPISLNHILQALRKRLS